MSTKKGRYGNPAKRQALVGDLAKLVQPTGIADPRTLGGTMVGGSARDSGATLIDPTDAVHLEHVDVCKVDAIRKGRSTGALTFMTLSGRVNKTDRQVSAGYFFGPDGGAAIITQLLSLADRDGAEFLQELTLRLIELSREGHADLMFLRTALDLAVELTE